MELLPGYRETWQAALAHVDRFLYAGMGYHMNAPTIASQVPEGLWQFLSAFWGSFEMQILIGLVLAGIVGQAASYIVKWARKEIEGNLLDYLFLSNLQATVLKIGRA